MLSQSLYPWVDRDTYFFKKTEENGYVKNVDKKPGVHCRVQLEIGWGLHLFNNFQKQKMCSWLRPMEFYSKLLILKVCCFMLWLPEKKSGFSVGSGKKKKKLVPQNPLKSSSQT